MKHQITYTVIPWSKNRYRAQVFVDGYGVEKAYFDTKEEAHSWGAAKVGELLQEVRM